MADLWIEFGWLEIVCIQAAIIIWQAARIEELKRGGH
jgi:hypothetical protein